MAAVLGVKGGSEPENKSCAVNNLEGDASEVAVNGTFDDLLFIEVGQGGGDRFETVTMTFGASPNFFGAA